MTQAEIDKLPLTFRHDVYCLDLDDGTTWYITPELLADSDYEVMKQYLNTKRNRPCCEIPSSKTSA